MTRLLVAGWTGTPNLGDELLFRAMTQMAEDRALDLTAVSQDPEATSATHGVDAVGRRDVLGLRAELGRADAVMLGPGGLLQDETSWLSLPNHLWRVWAARRRALPVAGIGLGAGPLDTAVGRRLVARGLGAAVGVAVRDQASVDLLERVGLSNVVLAADLAFRLNPPRVAPEDRLVACLRPYTGKGRVSFHEDEMWAARDRLAERAAGNDRVLDALLASLP